MCVSLSSVVSAEKLLALIHGIGGIVWEADPDSFQFTFVSTEAERILGFAASEWLAQPDFWRRHTHPDDVERCATFCRAATREGRDQTFEHRMIAADGRTVWLRDIVSVRASADGSPRLVGILLDITPQKRHEAERQRLTQEVDTAREWLAHASKVEAIGRLAGGVAHDFNNLLTVIAGYTDLVMGTMQKTDPRMADLEEIRRATQRASLLTRQLLAFSRKQVLRPEEIDLNAVVQEISVLIRRLIGEDVELEVATVPGPLPVIADRSQLEQVLMNLAVNARDAMPAGGQLHIRTRHAQGEAVLEVEDTGAGMSAEVKKRLFEPFFTTKEVGKGTGLGLSTVYGIVRQSGGDIQVHSEEGQGTRFTIALPPAGAIQPEAGPAPPEPAARETVLLVEDEVQVRDLVTQVLRRLGYEVVVASTVAGALELCRLHGDRIRLLLTDVALADASGPDVYAQVSAAVPSIAVLYLQKPFTSSALAGKVREVLDGRQAP
jgi:two-component system, cell cycle sensor histidine kinase and response regulator CckA